MDETTKRIAVYLSCIALFILFYVIEVYIPPSIYKHLSCAVLITQNMSTNDNGTGSAHDIRSTWNNT